MASLSIGIAVLLYGCVLWRAGVNAVPRDVKCTRNDPRKTYPHCMFGGRSKILWCDQSSYTKFPTVEEINSHLFDVDCITAKALFINDSCLQEIGTDDLQPYTGIRVFRGGQNYISMVKELTFHRNRELNEIDLCDNEINTLEQRSLKGLRKLRRLHLNNNKITSISHHLLKDLHNLEEVLLENNLLIEIDNRTFRRLPNLKTLNLKGNRIGKIHDFAFEKNGLLQHLYLDGNEIEIVTAKTFSGLKKLEILTISQNRIQLWPEEYGTFFVNVHTLHLGSNQLIEFTPSHTARMSSLQNLMLDNNSLSTIHEDLFMSTPRITHLNLSANAFEDIPEGSFRDLCHLESLILTKNQLHTPREGWFRHLIKRASEATHTDISENHWTCDCQIRKYKKFHDALMQRKDAASNVLAKKLEIRCQAPKFANTITLDQNLTAEIEMRLGCLPETVAESIGQTKAARTKNCRNTQSFNREYFDVTSQYIHHESREVISTTSTMSRMESKIPEAVTDEGVDFPLIIVIVLSILALILVLLYCGFRKK